MKFPILTMMIPVLLQVYFTTTCNAFCFHQQRKVSSCANNRVTIATNEKISPNDDNDGDDNASATANNNNNNNNNNIIKSADNRRTFLAATGSLVSSFAVVMSSPQSASAGIDVSGLRVDGGGVSGGGNSILKEQLKDFDGSASARVNQIKEISPSSSTASRTSTASNIPLAVEEEIDSKITTWLYRTNPTMSPRLSRAGSLRNLFRCDDQVAGPNGSGSVGISFEFPSDWLQLDKFLGGISYVDQRDGARLYVLKTKLPDGERLSTIPKLFFGESIFDSKGTIVKSQGIEIDEYKVSSATTISECPENSCATHKRYKIKYSTVTGNGLRVERRALVDAYEMSTNGDIYMMMTSSNAIKFENKDSPERQTVEAIVDSFRINV
jgi:hypothetical protein